MCRNIKVSETDHFSLVTNACSGARGKRVGIEFIFFQISGGISKANEKH